MGDRHRPRIGDRHRPRSGTRAKKATPQTQTPFLCIDGEAINDQYCLLAASDGTEEFELHGISSVCCFEFLLGLPVKELWGFGLTYDINNWLKDLSLRHIKILSSSKHNRVRWGCYRITHYYGKFLQLTRYFDGESKTVRIWDLYNFVGTSFVSMVKRWELAESKGQLDWLRFMKSKRTRFEQIGIAEVRCYNQLELELMTRAVARLKQLVGETGFIPKGWWSAGTLAGAAMDKYDIHVHLGRESIPDRIAIAAREAYYGGRFEVSKLGQIDGPLYHADIHSAYPSAMIKLPSLANGNWEHTGDDRIGDAKWGFARVTWKTHRGVLFAPFPVRLAAGSLRFPLESLQSSWYSLSEVSAAREIADVTVHDAYVFRPSNSIKPFSWLADLYQLRRGMKSSGDPSEHIIKLIINGVYGKLAQGITLDLKEQPKWQSIIYSAWLCADIRARLLACVAQCPHDIIFLAADGLACKRKLLLDEGDDLGQWEMNVLNWIFVVQSGVYFWSEAGAPKRILKHSRGVGQGKLNYNAVFKAWQEGREIRIKERHFVGYKGALVRDEKMSAWNQWIDDDTLILMTTVPRRRDYRRIGDVLHSLPLRYADPDDFHILLDMLMDSRAGDYTMIEQPSFDEGEDL